MKLFLSYLLVGLSLLSTSRVNSQSIGSDIKVSQTIHYSRPENVPNSLIQSRFFRYQQSSVQGLISARPSATTAGNTYRQFQYTHPAPFITLPSLTDPPYTISLRREIPVIAAGTVLVGSAAIIQSNVLPLTEDEVASLTIRGISGFDRSATKRFSVSARRASDLLLVASAGVPILYLIPQRTRHDFEEVLLMQAETLLLVSGVTELTKVIVKRTRPYVYNPNVALAYKLDNFARESFFSGHTSLSAAMSFFTASTFSQYYPGSKLKPFVWAYAIAMPAATGYFRYAAGRHFPTDVLAAYVVGAATGILVPKIHQQLRRTKRRGK